VAQHVRMRLEIEASALRDCVHGRPVLRALE
jgi:hypothetical protein